MTKEHYEMLKPHEFILFHAGAVQIDYKKKKMFLAMWEDIFKKKSTPNDLSCSGCFLNKLRAIAEYYLREKVYWDNVVAKEQGQKKTKRNGSKKVGTKVARTE